MQTGVQQAGNAICDLWEQNKMLLETMETPGLSSDNNLITLQFITEKNLEDSCQWVSERNKSVLLNTIVAPAIWLTCTIVLYHACHPSSLVPYTVENCIQEGDQQRPHTQLYNRWNCNILQKVGF